MKSAPHFSIFLLSFLLISLLPPSALAQSSDPVTKASDTDGDGLGDIILYDPTTSTFVVRESSTLTVRTQAVGSVGDIAATGDYDGDGKTDLSVFNRSFGVWTVEFANGQSAAVQFGAVGDIPVPGRYQSSGCTSFATFNKRTSIWSIGDCQGVLQETVTFGARGSIPAPADYDCDGQTDIAVFNPTTREWSIKQSTDGTTKSFRFGLWWDIPVPGDYDGDACAEAAVYRPDSNHFFIANEIENGEEEATLKESKQWGLSGDKAFLINVDGNAASDLAVLRPGNNTVYINTSGGFFFPIPLPGATAGNTLEPVWYQTMVKKKIAGDYDRDGFSELACVDVQRTQGTTLWSLYKSNGEQLQSVSPAPGDALVHADYNGDGKTQPAVVYVNPARPSPIPLEWHIQEANGLYSVQLFGVNTDAPLTGDFDCDGKSDKAIVRQNSGALTWWMDLSSNPENLDVLGHPFGLSGDQFFVADMTGDGCDELIVAREFLGGILWVYQNFLEKIDIPIFPHGLASDSLITPVDLDGDGKADLIAARANAAGGVDFFVKSTTGEISYIPFGLSGDTPIVGFYSGVNRPELAVYRRVNSTLYKKLFNSALGVQPQACNIIAAPTGQVFPEGRGQVGAAPTPAPTPPPSPNGCTATPGTETDFLDGRGGALWKPVSDNTRRPVILFPGSYWNNVDIDILDSAGNKILDVRPRTCCPNGGRAHYDVDQTGSSLRASAPITVRVRFNDGRTECRVVPDPAARQD